MDQTASKLKPGECVWCCIESPEPGGYTVSVSAKDIKGFLPSTQPIELGRVVPTTFVCMNGERALFTFAFTMGTSARVQHSTASDAENSFSVWVDAFPKSISLRRAVDLVMPSLSSNPILLKLNDGVAKEFFPKLEETGFTGCMKVYCQSSLSRAALIFLHGRAVGSIYTRKPIPDPYPFAIGIRKVIEDLSAPDADGDLEMYDLPEEIVLSMSSLFLGYVDEAAEKQEDKVAYAEKILSHFASHAQTACFNLLDEKTDTPFALGFVSRGEFKGTYTINERLFSEKKEFLFALMEKCSTAKLQVHILPEAMTSEAVRFGYSLSSEQFSI